MPTPTPTPTSLRPAYIITAELYPTVTIGQQSTGSQNLFAPVRSGSISTFPDFSPALSSSEVIVAGDWASIDPDGKHLRLDVRVVFKLDDSNEHIGIEYDGVMKMTEAVEKILASAADAETTEFGDVWTRPKFKTSEKYKQLQDSIFVGNGRWAVGEKGPQIQYHIFQVVGESGRL